MKWLALLLVSLACAVQVAHAVCGDGILDMGELCDTALSACCAPGCLSILPATTICRPSMGGCDVAEYCTGVSAECPVDLFRPAGYECRPIAIGSLCDVPEYCTGHGPTCPVDMAASNKTVCRVPSVGLECVQTQYCPGTLPSQDPNAKACPADVALSSQTKCRYKCSQCDVTEYCPGPGAVGEFTCPTDYNLATTTNTSYSNSCTLRGMGCAGGSCSSFGSCNEGYSGCGTFASCPTICGQLYNPIQPPHINKHEWNRCIQDKIIDYVPVHTGTLDGDPGFTDGVFSVLPSGTFSCNGGPGSYTCKNPSRIPDPSTQNFSPKRTHCYIASAYWFDYDTAYAMGTFGIGGSSIWDFEPATHALLASVNETLRPYIYADILSTNPANSCQYCAGETVSDTTPPNTFTNKATGAYCLLPESLRAANNPCANQAFGVVGRCQGNTCVPFLETNTTRWGMECRAATGVCDKPEYCSQDGSSYLCPADKLRGEDESWLYYTVDSEFPEGFNRIGLYSTLVQVDSRPALAYSARRGSGENHTVFYAINQDQEAMGTWDIVVIENSMNVDTLPHVDAALVNGRPAAVWTSGSNIWFGISNDNVGLSGWTNAFIGNTLAVSTQYNDPLNLLEVLGRPAIVYILPTGGVRYAINSNTDGSGTWSFVTIDVTFGITCTGTNRCGQHSKAMVANGRPMFAYVNNYASVTDKLAIARANTDNGLGGWTTYEVSTADVLDAPVSFNVIDGRPAILFQCTVPANCLKFAISSNADGTGTWTVSTIPMPSPATSHCSGDGLFMNGCRLMEWRGRPYIAITFNEQIYYGINSAADGSGTWTYTTDGEYAGSYGIFPDDTPLHITKIGTTPSMVYQRGDFYGPLIPPATCPTPTNTTNPEIVKYATIDSFKCRSATGSCDIPEYCSGYSTECPADSVKLNGTTPTGAVVRGPCEVLAPCDGVAGSVNVNGTEPRGPTYVCRPSAGACDAPEYCPDPNLVAEWWLCPADEYYNATQECRPAAGLCDVPEYCSGSSPTCDAPDLLLASGTVCRSAADVCDVEETCDGVLPTCPSDAFRPSGFECRASQGSCDPAEQCTGSSTACPIDALSPLGTVCMSARGPCEDDHTCNGVNVTCPEPAPFNTTVVCRVSQGICDYTDHCPGDSYNCTADLKYGLETVCRATADLCDIEERCDGVSNNCGADIVHSAGFTCHEARGPCEIPQQCDGVTVTCPAYQFRDGTYTCRAQNGTCDVSEQCNPFALEPWLCPTDAFFPAGSICATSVGLCSDNGYCTGTSGQCPGVTIYNSTTLCRAAQGQCDVSEYCDGVSELCPTDTFVAAGTTCVANPLNCTVDECNGSGTCEVVQDNCQCMVDNDCAANVTAPCVTSVCVNGACEFGVAAGFCYIDGTCYPNGLINPSSECVYCNATANSTDWTPRPSGDPCNTGTPTGLCSAQDTCDGAGVCVDQYLASGTECRAAASVCDAPEQCTGSSNFCPTDVFVPQGTLCRNATGDCDVPEYCDNMGQCPSDGVEAYGVVCLAARGVCEEDGICDGIGKNCSERLLLPSGALCRAATLPCDVPEYCDAVSYDCPADAVQPSSFTCRISAGPCDSPEQCDGITKLCPTDVFYGPAHLCRMASGSCEEDGYCTLGTEQCEPVAYKPSGTVCQSSSSLCADDATCDGATSTCPALTPLPNGTQCHTARGPCEGPGYCDGVALTCQIEGQKPDGTVCRASTDICDPQETCNSALPNPWLCPVDFKRPDGYPCPDALFCNGDETCLAGVCEYPGSRDCSDGSPCTVDTCNEDTDMCVHAADPQIGMVCYDGPIGTADVGICRSGTIQCFGNGTFYCANQVLPGPMEICGDGLDNDCDGAPDNGCAGVTCVDDGDCIPFAPSACQYGVCDTQSNLCLYPVTAGQCLIGGSCKNSGDVNPTNPCQQCQPGVSQVSYTANDGLDPSDGDVCNGLEICSGGQVVLSTPPLVCPISNNTCVPYMCTSIFGCIQGPLPVNSSCTLQYPYACDGGTTLCDSYGDCTCYGGVVIDVRNRPINPDGPGTFSALFIVIISVFGGLFVAVCLLALFITYMNQRSKAKKAKSKNK